MGIRSFRTRGSLIAVGIVAAAGIGLGSVAWTVSDRIEERNEFCLGCHLTPQTRLHSEIGRDFQRDPPASLASFHASVGVESRPDTRFRCIDCHGGSSWPGRARVKLLAANDAFWYATGHFEEPTEMAWPLWDEDCRKCHDSFDTTLSDAGARRFHELDGHNEGLGVDCVECHRVHDPEVDPEASFLNAEWVRGRCALCHVEFQGGRGG